jgi:hypothetical protein
MPASDPRIFRSEGAITSRSEDRLGFWPVAEALQNLLMVQPTGQGLVIGVVGKWGSGKSSVLELALSTLRRREPAAGQAIAGTQNPILVEFKPWLIGHRDALLTELFVELVAAIDGTYNPHADLTDDIQRTARQVREALKRYAKVIKAASVAAPVVDHFTGLHVFTPISRIAIGFSSGSPKPIAESREQVVTLLRQLGRRIIVTIDDLDRLEPSEAIEVLRLTRAVADFPNITYVACFDPAILADNVKTALGISNGEAFLQKIFQATISVPNPDGFDLRHWLQEEVSKLIGSPLGGQELDLTASNRLARVILQEGERTLTSPRDVVRVLNLLAVYWPPVAGQVDVADLVWLSMVRVHSPELFSWVAEYTEEISQFQLGAGVGDVTRSRLTGRLKEILEREGRFNRQSYFSLQEIFPAFKANFLHGSDIPDFDLFGPIDKEKRVDFEREHRLGAANAARRYFAFNTTRGGLTSADLATAIEGFSDKDKATEILLTASSQTRPQGGDMGQMLLETLGNHIDAVPNDKAGVLCLAMADALDEGVRGKAGGQFGRQAAWVAGERLLEAILQRPEIDRDTLLMAMFEKGRAFAWLSDVLRLQYAVRTKNAHDPRLMATAETLDKISAIFLARVEGGNPCPTATPYASSVLWAWRDLGGGKQAREWCDKEIRTDQGLVNLLEGLRGWLATSKDVYLPLTRRGTSPFIDFENCWSRIKALSAFEGPLQKQARVLDEAFRIGDQHEPKQEIPI